MKKILICIPLLFNCNSFFPGSYEATVSAIGDIMAHDELQNYVLANKKKYDIYFEYTKNIFIEDDLTIANLETVVSDELPVSGYPDFNARTGLIDAIKRSSIDVLSTANNHAYDYGVNGVRSTVSALNKRGIIFSGTGLKPGDSAVPVMFNVKKIKFAFLSMTSFLNKEILYRHMNKSYINLAPLEDSKAFTAFCDIIKNTRKKSDIMIVSCHYGDEYTSIPTASQEKAMKLIAEAGADVVLGHHPHVLQKIEYYETGDKRKTLLAYSLGNFISSYALDISKMAVSGTRIMNSRFTAIAEGIILQFDVKKIKSTFHVLNPRAIPVFNLKFPCKSGDKHHEGFMAMTAGGILKIDNNKDPIFGERIYDVRKLLSKRMEIIKKTVNIPIDRTR